MNAELKGLNEFPGTHPQVAPVFWSFRVMVGVGSLMMLVSWFCGWKLWQQRRQKPEALQLSRPVLWTLVGMTFPGWVATQAGWFVTEIGRQPCLVYGLLKTSEAVAPHSTGHGGLVAHGLPAALRLPAAVVHRRAGLYGRAFDHAHDGGQAPHTPTRLRSTP